MNELLAVDLATHHKMLLVTHKFKRTELVLANQNKEHAINHTVCLWKAKRLETKMSYLPQGRVFDMNLVMRDSCNSQRPAQKLLVYHNITKGPLIFSIIDLETKTTQQVL